MHAGDAEQEQVGGDPRGGLGGGGAAGDRRVLEQPPAEQEDLEPGWSTSAAAMVGLCVMTVRRVDGQRAGDGEGGGAAVEDDGGPAWISAAARAATRRLLSGSTRSRAA